MYRLNSSFDSFDTLQKLILSELENVFDDLADVMAKFNDVVQKTCWTFENEVGLWWFLSLSLKVPDDHTNKKKLAFKYIFSLKLYEKEFFLTFVTLKAGFHYVSFPVGPKVDHNQFEHFENP